jgi:hypothetical protein
MQGRHAKNLFAPLFGSSHRASFTANGYDDDDVQVTGTLNRAGDTIHVQSIKKLYSDELVPFSAAGK